VDTTPLFLEGIWYLLTTSARHGHETFLFWSKTLDGEWHYHPRNPICSDVRRARGAGPLFRCHGTLIRPAQDCSVRYGYAIALNRVLKISPADYSEELIEVIYPKWRPGLLGTHTLSSNEAFEAIDGLRYSS
jgi:beta-xylosidase